MDKNHHQIKGFDLNFDKLKMSTVKWIPSKRYGKCVMLSTMDPCLTTHIFPVNEVAVDLWSNIIATELPSSHIPSLLGFYRLRMYGNGYSMAIVLDHRSTGTSWTGNRATGPWAARVL